MPIHGKAMIPKKTCVFLALRTGAVYKSGIYQYLPSKIDFEHESKEDVDLYLSDVKRSD